jgi:hypothetical protein
VFSQVFSVFYRLASPGHEHRKLIELLIKSPVAVDQQQQAYKEIDQQYQAIVAQLRWFSFPALMDMVAIVGESNAHLSHKLLSAVLLMKPEFGLEFTASLDEVHRTVCELLQSSWQTWDRFILSTNKGSSALKKNSRVINKAALLHKNNPLDHLKEMLFLTTFAVDIVYSLHAILAAIDKWYLSQTTLLKAYCLSQQMGMVWYRIFQMIYEVELPIIAKTIKHARQLRDENVESVEIVTNLQESAETLRYWCLKNVKEMIDSCVYCVNHKHPKTSFGPARAKDVTITEQTWIDVFSNRLDLDKILIGVTINGAELQPGALASDYLLSCDRSHVQSLVMASMNMDVTQVNGLLSSMCFDDSLLPNKSVEPTTLSTKSAFLSLDDTKLDPVTKPNAEVSSELMHENIVMIQSIFPELGEGFVEACLGFYKNSTEEVIEALLSNNLHPQLSAIDRSLKKMWVGKAGLVRDTGSLHYTKDGKSSKAHEGKINYKAFMNESVDENKKFKEVQKSMVKSIEKSEQYDAYIVDKEYDDDYDDQVLSCICSLYSPNILVLA